jgi:hypothetical protein
LILSTVAAARSILVRGQGAVRFRNAEIRLDDRRFGANLIEHLGEDPVLVEQCFLTLQRDLRERYVRALMVRLAPRGLQRALLGSELGFVLGKLLLHFGDLGHREHSTRLHVIAEVDANIGQVSGDFGEEIRLLEGGERGVGFQPLTHCAAARMDNINPCTVLTRSFELRRLAGPFLGLPGTASPGLRGA